MIQTCVDSLLGSSGVPYEEIDAVFLTGRFVLCSGCETDFRNAFRNGQDPRREGVYLRGSWFGIESSYGAGSFVTPIRGYINGDGGHEPLLRQQNK